MNDREAAGAWSQGFGVVFLFLLSSCSSLDFGVSAFCFLFEVVRAFLFLV